jgi:hypothetical protein
MLSNVLYPFLNPVWDSEIKPTSSDNSHNLSFRTEVKVLLRHDTILNSPITEEEILQVVKIFKSNKASGYDDIVNEHIKSTINIVLPKLYYF